MLHIVVCDDLPEQISALQATLETAMPNKEYQLETYTGVSAMLDALSTSGGADILLLDICMPEQDGISVARKINEVYPDTQIIFTSAYSGYALDVYETEHIYFLTKPVSPERLHAALTRATQRIASLRDTRVTLPVKGGAQRLLQLSEILYFERQDHLTRVVLTEGSLYTPPKLSDIEPLLPPDAFARPHNSYLVNLAAVRETTRTATRLSNGDELPISNQKRASFLQTLARSL